MFNGIEILQTCSMYVFKWDMSAKSRKYKSRHRQSRKRWFLALCSLQCPQSMKLDVSRIWCRQNVMQLEMRFSRQSEINFGHWIQGTPMFWRSTMLTSVITMLWKQNHYAFVDESWCTHEEKLVGFHAVPGGWRQTLADHEQHRIDRSSWIETLISRLMSAGIVNFVGWFSRYTSSCLRLFWWPSLNIIFRHQYALKTTAEPPSTPNCNWFWFSHAR